MRLFEGTPAHPNVAALRGLVTLFAVLVGAGCARGDHLPIATAGEDPARSPPATAVEIEVPTCDEQHLYDTVAKACRLYPGGGNGWAGCSQSTEPPNGEACITTTRWDHCDCVCEDEAKRWDAAEARCL